MSSNTTANAVTEVEMASRKGGAALTRPCAVCDNRAKFQCSVCSNACYCSQECQLKDWPSHQPQCQSITSAAAASTTATALSAAPQSSAQHQHQPEQRQPAHRRRKKRARPAIMSFNAENFELDPETISELRYYLIQIYSILKPVVVCIFFAVLWMKLTNPISQVFELGLGSGGANIYVGGVQGVVAGGTNAQGATTSDLTTALIIISQIIVATIVIYLLFRYNCMKILYGFFGLIVLGLLGMFGYVLGTDLLSIYSVPFDWISFMFFLWNLAGVGMVSIFWKGPLLLQQCYLVLMSTLMALSLSSLPAVTSWILLSLLAVWDLIAVLCPYGPLRLLIENSQENNREIPALLYSAGPTTMMASPASKPTYIEGPSEFLQATSSENDNSLFNSASLNGSAAVLTAGNRTEDVEIAPIPTITGETARAAESAPVEDDDDGSTSGMKLGLGDFVFYSVLSSRAALLDWVSTMTVIIAVITGLNMTIFLLVLFQKALPALPISIMFGLLFYFVSYLTLVPMVNQLTNMPDRLNFTAGVGNAALWAGQNGGAGLIYV
ncbi:Presenilin-domain-containing protein [Rhizoclosmatium globosum]|uniref:Presenilin n=1 Tax=Rhizoclosmatium globosum TaxID=329046 RepID=A0A1Y2CZM9_9FUNG|nr:Presenilin-domain-containing protein [Rhizoclosmatium globosum]|eukprot:ORY52407.1 Presenilin-domain-containing protein [Rhizoclosmatium globosum]